MNRYKTKEKIEAIDALIVAGVREKQDVGILKEIATDLRGRLEHAPSITKDELARGVANVMNNKTRNGYHVGPLASLGEFVTGRWPLIQQALERFGAELESKP